MVDSSTDFQRMQVKISDYAQEKNGKFFSVYLKEHGKLLFEESALSHFADYV
jgi:glycine cleavage system H lipoate-binding protein